MNRKIMQKYILSINKMANLTQLAYIPFVWRLESLKIPKHECLLFHIFVLIVRQCIVSAQFTQLYQDYSINVPQSARKQASYTNRGF